MIDLFIVCTIVCGQIKGIHTIINFVLQVCLLYNYYNITTHCGLLKRWHVCSIGCNMWLLWMFNFHHHFHCQCSVYTELLHVINTLLRYMWLTMYYLGYVVSIYTVNVYLHVENAVKLKNAAYTCMFLIIDQDTQLCVSS